MVSVEVLQKERESVCVFQTDEDESLLLLLVVVVVVVDDAKSKGGFSNTEK
jgi:hypothetical protein